MAGIHATPPKAGEKTRPQNNDHCFQGLGRKIWLERARGLTVLGTRSGPDGTRLDYAMDTDDRAMHNGGMVHPQETRMAPGIWYRFYGTVAHNRFGAAGCMAGGWWIDPEAYFTIRDTARARDISLAKLAQALLVIPDGWHDCGYVGRAMLTRRLRASVGHGKPATGRTSPHNPLRDRAADPIVAAPAHLSLKQWFVPGERDLLGRFFTVQATLSCIHKGVAL